MLMDVFLCEVVINKEKLQLLEVSALLIASKFFEGTFPSVKHFYCNWVYKTWRSAICRPLTMISSYHSLIASWLAKLCAGNASKMAAAALFTALSMVGEKQASNITLEYYFGYNLANLGNIK
uniref:Cyclin N-terminal domain-containing protein n=1 Tax=Glossina palpalis gambiensis TaxID=67801 RepID=A0A1B0C7U6_9MUSC